MSSPAAELEPWVLLLEQHELTTLALWRISSQQQDALALFSDRELADNYAESHCESPWQTRQLKGETLIRVLANCYQQGVHYASLNPTTDSARQIFVLKDVLKAARENLR